ncbi:insulinase family protein [Caulobacter sp. SLTY]|uniref:M16 family metallopeptidase n=1 Tax=Caulobacter sp. SLTY TaxID=2683262 RepID=UPI00141247EC|nr:M16 family metallopeptidase [Caulobacter sp. SLTY]NBB14971.1 insulinase family protein [Caulobacter sp. SLTY]
MLQTTRFARPALIAATVLALAGCAQVRGLIPGQDRPAAAAPAPRAAAPDPTRLPPGVWPQVQSDIAPDPAVRFGSLPNGMRYALMKNATPPGATAIRLHFRAGSLHEADDQQGLAHFLEHMAFNGSKAIPEGEMVKVLERHGLAFGADTNASTSMEETVYKLDLPKSDDETVDISLKLMRETAGELLIDAAAVDRERGVVLSEERARDTPGWQLYQKRLEFQMRGQRPPLRYPIGKVEILQKAPRDRIAAFYDAYYRPERTTLVIVGDFDLDKMETKVKTVFGDWTARGPDGRDPDLGPVAERQAEALVAIQPGSPTAFQLTWMRGPELERDTADKRRRDLVETLGFAVLNRRLAALARGGEPPFISAGAFKGDQFHAATATSIAVTARPGEWRVALQAAEQEQRRAVQYGVLQSELDREIEEYRAFFKSRVAGAATQRTPALAGVILGSLDYSEVVTSPQQDLDLFEAAVKDLKAETVSATLKDAFRGNGPLIFVATPTAIDGAEVAVMDAYNGSLKVAVSAPTEAVRGSWPYADFGAPGKVVEEKDIVDLDTTFIRFENGVRLTVKPTKFRDDQVMVRVRIGSGLLGQPSDRQNLAWGAGSIVEGGLGKISREDMERVLAGKVYGVGFGIDEEALTFSGGTRPEDAELQMQVLAAYVTDPAWRPAAFNRVRAAAATYGEQYEMTTGGVLARDLSGLLRAGDKRWTTPTSAEIKATQLEQVKAQVMPDLTGGPIEVIIVGDITVERAVEITAATFGALPRRPDYKPVPDAARVVGFPAPNAEPLVLTHKGRADQSAAVIVWRTDDFYSNVQRARNTSMMAEILGLRLIDELRERQGATYSPNASANHSGTWTDWGLVMASVEVPPDKLDGFFRDTLKIAGDLRDAPPTEDEMIRARKPYLERLAKSQVTNEYWLGQLGGAQYDPRRLDAVRSAQAGIEGVSPQDVQAAARQFLADGRAWRVVVKPEKSK